MEEKKESSLALSPLARRTLLTGAAGTVGALAVGTATATAATPGRQPNWRWCRRCQTLFYFNGFTTGWCVRGGGHDCEGSGKYEPYHNYPVGQDQWRWCNRCQCMCYGGLGSQRGQCPSGDRHDYTGSGNYSIEQDGRYDASDQTGWRWCNKCYCLCYAGNGRGPCPVRGRHNFNGSGHYYLPHSS